MLGGGLEYPCFMEISLYSILRNKLSRIENRIPDIENFKWNDNVMPAQLLHFDFDPLFPLVSHWRASCHHHSQHHHCPLLFSVHCLL